MKEDELTETFSKARQQVSVALADINALYK